MPRGGILSMASNSSPVAMPLRLSTSTAPISLVHGVCRGTSRRSGRAGVALCLAAALFACSTEPPTQSRTTKATPDAGIAYPSSVAYDADAGVLLVGSYENGSVRRVTAAGDRSAIAPALPDDGREHVLRVRLDAARQRIWVLASEGVYLYDAKTAQRVTHFPIDPLLAQHSSDHCLPDMALDRTGNVFISSAVQAALIRVDAATLEVSHHVIHADADRGMDFGFSALTFAGPGDTLYAASATTGSLWKIDLQQNRASKIALTAPLYGACALAAEAVVDKAGEALALYVSGGFRNNVKRVALSGAAPPFPVRAVQPTSPLVTPTDFLLMNREMLLLSSHLSRHPDFNGDGRTSSQLRLVRIAAH